MNTPPEPHQAPTNRMAMGMLWLLVLVVLVSFFAWLEARQHNPNRQFESRVSGTTVEIVLEQNRAGHYVVNGQINGHEVDLFLDTGATAVVIPGDTADQLRLQRGGQVLVQTANGDAIAYLTRLDEVRIGPIVQNNVRALIQPSMEGEILLGMSFLRELEMVQRDRNLILRQY